MVGQGFFDLSCENFLGNSMEEAKKNMYAFSTTTYTGFQCTVSEETSEKFKGKCWFMNFSWKPYSNSFAERCYLNFSIAGLPGVLWVLPDSYIDVKNKDYGGLVYILSLRCQEQRLGASFN